MMLHGMNFAISISQAVYKKIVITMRRFHSMTSRLLPMACQQSPRYRSIEEKRLLISLFLCCQAVRGGV